MKVLIKWSIVLSFMYMVWCESRPYIDLDKIKYEKYKNEVPKSHIPKEVLIYFKVTKERIRTFETGYKNLELNYGEKKIIAKYKTWLQEEKRKKKPKVVKVVKNELPK